MHATRSERYRLASKCLRARGRSASWLLAGRAAAEAGFSLIEAIIAIAITGIIAGIVAIFIQRPLQGYFDTTRRAELVDIADTAARRMVRDLRLALPNSVRVTNSAGAMYLEFLLTSGGGRYRAEKDASNGGNVLDFVAGSSVFDVLGPMPTVSSGDTIVVYNLGPGFSEADAYQPANNNRATVAAIGAGTISLSAAKLFPYDSPGKRFHVVQQTVSYVCVPDALNPAAGSIRRRWGYPIQAAQPTTFTAGSEALIAMNVAACAFTYTPAAVAQRNGVVALAITLSKSQESITLFQEAHVSNVP